MPNLIQSLSGDDDPESDQSPSDMRSNSPSSPFTTPVISTPGGLLEASSMGESITETMQESHHTDVSMEQHNAEADGTTVGADLSSFTLTDNENPIFITGDDGTVYQVAGQNEQGQTILLTQG